MKKSDLKTGMVVETRSGERGLVLLNTTGGDIIGGSSIENGKFNKTWFPLDSLNNDLMYDCSESTDIMKVYNFKSNSEAGSLNVRELIWERKEEKIIITIDDVEYSESTLRSLIKKATK